MNFTGLKSRLALAVVLVLTLMPRFSQALDLIAPDNSCLDNGRTLDIINEQVLVWKTTTENAFMARAHIKGTVDKVFPDHSNHRHFSLKIGQGPQDHIEVIYNLSFGKLPVPAIGMVAEACGDYITSIAQTGPYPPSPDGGIIHWVHRSPHGHDPGYVILNGIKY